MAGATYSPLRLQCLRNTKPNIATLGYAWGRRARLGPPSQRAGRSRMARCSVHTTTPARGNRLGGRAPASSPSTPLAVRSGKFVEEDKFSREEEDGRFKKAGQVENSSGPRQAISGPRAVSVVEAGRCAEEEYLPREEEERATEEADRMEDLAAVARRWSYRTGDPPESRGRGPEASRAHGNVSERSGLPETFEGTEKSVVGSTVPSSQLVLAINHGMKAMVESQGVAAHRTPMIKRNPSLASSMIQESQIKAPEQRNPLPLLATQMITAPPPMMTRRASLMDQTSQPKQTDLEPKAKMTTTESVHGKERLSTGSERSNWIQDDARQRRTSKSISNYYQGLKSPAEQSWVVPEPLSERHALVRYPATTHRNEPVQDTDHSTVAATASPSTREIYPDTLSKSELGRDEIQDQRTAKYPENRARPHGLKEVERLHLASAVAPFFVESAIQTDTSFSRPVEQGMFSRTATSWSTSVASGTGRYRTAMLSNKSGVVPFTSLPSIVPSTLSSTTRCLIQLSTAHALAAAGLRPFSTTPIRRDASEEDKGDKTDKRFQAWMDEYRDFEARNPGDVRWQDATRETLRSIPEDQRAAVEKELAQISLAGEDADDLVKDVRKGFADFRKPTRRKKGAVWSEDESDPYMVSDEIDEDDFKGNDITSMAHGKLEELRERRQYERITVWEMPLLSKYAKQFEKPSDEEVLRFRYTTYMGEFHPAEKKVVVQFCPADLDLTEAQQLKLKKLVGPRYNPEKDMVHMSCEAYEHQAQNRRYLGDMVEKIIAQARDPTDMFEDIPLDLRHHTFKKKPKFPKEWRLTVERQKQIQAVRAEAFQLDQAKKTDGTLVDGKQLLQDSLAAPPPGTQERIAELLHVPADRSRSRSRH